MSTFFTPRVRGGDAPVVIFKLTERGYEMICHNVACRRSLDPVAKEIYGTIVKVREFFLENFGRWGLDGRGSMVPVIIRWNEKQAVWTCTAGPCRLKFNDIFALRPEVVAHEYMHGIIQGLNPLQYQGQSGALNESLADAMGIAFKYWLTGTVDWKIAHLRNLSHYASMRSYLNTREDNGGVHTNSAIPNHAFYQAIQNVGSINLVAQIWFQAFKEVGTRATFKEFAKKTIEVAERSPSSTALNILAAWSHVDVLDVTKKERFVEYWDTRSMVPIVSREPIYVYS